jgi:hypothetical protein
MVQYNWPWFCTYAGMDSLLRLRYRLLADSNKASLSPAGAVWRYIRANYPSIQLYDADESHPSPAGSYAVACAFYVALFNKNPISINYSFGLGAAEAANIRQAAKAVVYDSMSYWHIGQYRTEASFTYMQSGSAVNFNNASQHANSFSWYFGDGQSDTAANPEHNYGQSGTYNLMLVVSDSSGCRDTTYGTISISPTKVEQALNHPPIFTIAPNPCRGNFIIDMPQTEGTVMLSDVYGRIMFRGHMKDRLSVDVQALPPGLYLVRIRNGEGDWNGSMSVY